MTALGASANRLSKDGSQKSYPVAADAVIWKGALIVLDAGGDADPAADASGTSHVVGVADEDVDNTGGADADLNVRVISGRAFRFAATAITIAMLGDRAYVVDDNTVDNGSGTNDVIAGNIIQVDSTTQCWVYIPTGGHAGAANDPRGFTGLLATTVTGIVVADGVVTSITGT